MLKNKKNDNNVFDDVEVVFVAAIVVVVFFWGVWKVKRSEGKWGWGGFCGGWKGTRGGVWCVDHGICACVRLRLMKVWDGAGVGLYLAWVGMLLKMVWQHWGDIILV